MAMIDNLGKFIIIIILKNRLVDDTKKAKKYKQMEKVQQTKSELKSGKLIKIINNLAGDKKVKIFRLTAYTKFSGRDGK